MYDSIHILPTLITMTAVICLGGAVLLFLRGRYNRSRRLLAGIMAAWGVFYMVRGAGMLFGNHNLNFTRTDIMAPFVLEFGNLYLITLLLYPLEVIRPGWLNLKRIGILLLPYVSVSLFYHIVLFLLGQKPLVLHNLDQFWEHLGEFNVWYRLLMALVVIVYLVFLFRLSWNYKKFYEDWCRNNYSDDENKNISWLRQYGIGVTLIGVAYFWLLSDGNTYCFYVHNLTVQCFFCYTLYKGLFHDNPYTENFFNHTLDEAEACQKAELMETQPSADNISFSEKLPAYCDEIANWMTTEKPYLNPDFKLMDVSTILPLNRTYLSKVFNEGFGNSFSNVVRNYRIREAEQMLVSRKNIPVGQVGELCGFSSPSVFYRAFAQSHNGMTPNHYRKQMLEE